MPKRSGERAERSRLTHSSLLADLRQDVQKSHPASSGERGGGVRGLYLVRLLPEGQVQPGAAFLLVGALSHVGF